MNFLDWIKIDSSLYDNTSITKKEVSIPLCWEITPNPIERSYLEWIKSDKINSKIYLITWPWNEVKFIPLLVQNFLYYQKPKTPVVIFSKHVKKGHSMDGLKSPIHNILFRCLFSYHLDDTKINYLNLDNKTILFDKIEKILKSKDAHLLVYDLNGEKVTRITMRAIGNKELPAGAEDPFRQKIRFKGKINYNKDWMAFIVANYNKLFRPELDRVIEIVDFQDFPEEKISGEKIIFIKSKHENSPKSSLLTDYIEKPSLVIIENLEYFLHYFRRNDLYEFLRSLQDKCIVLLFSTTPGQRYLHINFIEKFNQQLEFHCWDTKTRIDWLSKNILNEDKENKYINPGTSKFEEIRGFY